MVRGAKGALLVSCIAFTGCVSGAKPVEVRAIADPSAVLRGGGDDAAVARGQLALGNAGLALEGFRKAQRLSPYDPAILAGIGECYAAMGRLDLAQSNYEAALALTPHDAQLLLGLAAIYEREGKTARAMIARTQALEAHAEATALPETSPSKPVAVSSAAPATPASSERSIPKPTVGSITVQLPAAHPASHLEARATAPPMPEIEPAIAEPVEIPAAAPTPEPMLISSLAQAAEIPAGSPPAPVGPPLPEPAIRSVTVELPAAKPAEHLETRAVASALLQIEEPPTVSAPVASADPGPAPAPLPRRPDANVAMIEAAAPRLERLTRGEVALITTGKPLWRSSANVRTASATTVRWVALASAPGHPNVRILNAARSQGLAASARTVLVDRGWRKVAVGDAPATQRQSVVLYPKGQGALGRRLARQFGVAAQMAERNDVLLVLGHDAVDRVARQRGS
jgi:hypothetical protein